VREAEHLLEALAAEQASGVDVMLAHPLIGPELEHLGRLRERHPEVELSVLCEDPLAVPSIPAGLGIHVDVNPGMNRTGIPLEQPELVAAVARAAGARFRGVHYYDGHLHEGDAEQRRRDTSACYDRLLQLLAALERDGLQVPEVTTSGTPTFLQALAYAPLAELEGTVHRVSPGTVVFHDARSEEESVGLGLVPAALVFARVVSHPAPDLVTCDAGSKSVAAEAGDPCALALGRPELEALTPSEEHLPFRVTSGAKPPRGTELLLVPRHVCPTVNLAEQALLIEGGAVRGTVAVSARAHALGLA
jgi:D-serine deaminase-like pyridoxal phosphate-dependent protein